MADGETRTRDATDQLEGELRSTRIYNLIVRTLKVGIENGGADAPLSKEDTRRIIEDDEEALELLTGEDVSEEEVQEFVKRRTERLERSQED